MKCYEAVYNVGTKYGLAEKQWSYHNGGFVGKRVPKWLRFQRGDGTNGAMAEIGASQHQLVDEVGVQSGRKLPQYIAALAATLGALAAGAMLGWSSPAGPKIVNGTEYSFPVSNSENAWVGSLVNLGAAAVCFPIGLVMDRIGRKPTMLLLVIPFTVGWALIIWATNVSMLMVGRFITGMAGGAFCVTAPAYTSEIAEVSIRGSLGSYFQLMITIGILFAYAVGAYTSVFLFSLLCAVLPLIFGVVFFFMPESPSYLVKKGKNDEARESLIKLRGQSYDVDSELSYLKSNAEHAKNNPVSFVSSITKKAAVKAMIICYFLMLFQQLSGINAVIFNTNSIFSSAGAAIDPAIATIIIGIIQVVATLVSSLIVDKLGRRILLLFSACVMCLCLTALGVFFFLQLEHGEESSIVQAISWLPLVALSLFIIAFSVGFGPIPWMVAGELCLIDIKAFVSSTAGTFNWLLSFAVTSTFQMLKDSIGDAQVFWMFAGIMVLAFVFIFIVVPETKGKSLEEIQAILNGKPAPPRVINDEKN